MVVLGSVARVNGLFVGRVVGGGLSSGHFVEVAGPDVPVLIDVIDLFVALFVIFVVNHVLEGLSDPTEIIVFLSPQHFNRLVQRLEVWNNPHEIRQRQHRSQGLGLVADGLGKQHQGRRDQVLRDEDVERVL